MVILAGGGGERGGGGDGGGEGGGGGGLTRVNLHNIPSDPEFTGWSLIPL